MSSTQKWTVVSKTTKRKERYIANKKERECIAKRMTAKQEAKLEAKLERDAYIDCCFGEGLPADQVYDPLKYRELEQAVVDARNAIEEVRNEVDEFCSRKGYDPTH